jgi:hypothetical protein
MTIDEITELIDRRSETPHVERKAGFEWMKENRDQSYAREQVGLTGMLRHDFRRTAVRNMERAGVPRSVAMKVSGHKTESIYRRYAIVNESDIRDATTKLLRAQNGHNHPSTVDSLSVSH